MKKIRIISDIHTEFSKGKFDLPIMKDEDKQVLVLAGDVGLADKPNTYIPFLQEVSERFQDVIYLGGNHEFYGSSIVRGLDKIKEQVANNVSKSNVHVVNNEVIRIGDISFVCSTLWASYDNQSALCMYNAELMMNDHKKIRFGSFRNPYERKFKASDAVVLFMQSKSFIFSNIVAEHEAGQKVVVVTHHAPSVLSIASEFKTGPYASLNGAYASSLEEDIFNTSPELMIHGHTHVSFDYMLEDELTPNGGKTRILCNPYGYYNNSVNPNFNPTLVVNL